MEFFAIEGISASGLLSLPQRSPRRAKRGRGFHMIFTFGASSFRGLGRAFERAMVTENVVKRGDTFSIEHADEGNKNGDFPDVQ